MTKFHVTTMIVIAGAVAAVFFLAGVAEVVAVAVLAAAWLVMTVLGVSFVRWGFFGETLCRGAGDERRVALTFDDGPDETVTPALLDVLKEVGVQATFFCVGKKVAKSGEVARRIVAEGHIIGNHSDAHGWWLNFLLAGSMSREIKRAQGAIFEATGRLPRFYRPPVGLTNPHTGSALARLGMVAVGWDVRAFDKQAQTRQIVSRVRERVRPGSIILLHDAGVDVDTQKDAVRGIIAALREADYEFARLDELLNESAWREGGAT